MTFRTQPAPAPGPQTPINPALAGTRTAPAKPQLDLSTAQNVREKTPLELPPQGTPLPSDVQAQINTFWTAMQAAEGAYNILATGYLSIWESVQYPMEYRQGKAAEFMDAVFVKQAADLQRAEDALKAAQVAVRVGLTPPALGDSTTHELKLMNAREEVKLALEGLQPQDQLNTLDSMFNEALDDGNRAIAHFIGGTDSYKRLLRDKGTRLAFGGMQPDLLKRLLPPTAEGYLRAGPVLEELGRILEQAMLVRGFTAQDNGLALHELRP